MILPVQSSHTQPAQPILSHPDWDPNAFEYFEYGELLSCRQLNHPEIIYVFHPTARQTWEWEQRSRLPYNFDPEPFRISPDSVENRIAEILARPKTHPEISPASFCYYISWTGTLLCQQSNDRYTLYSWNPDLHSWELLPRLALESFFGYGDLTRISLDKAQAITQP